MWDADPATRFNPTPPASTCDCIMCQIRSPHDLPVMGAFAAKTFRQRCGRRRTALLSACALGDETMAAMLVEPTTTAGALDAVGCDGCSALWWAESRGMHAVAQSLRDSGATAGRRPALELCRGEADAADVDMKGQTVEFSGSCATLRSAERCRLGKRKYWELQVLAIESNSRLRCGATSSLGSMFSASDTGLGDDPQSWAVNGLARVFMHKGEKQDYKCAPWKEGDVIGIACDLVQMQMRVSLNGNFAAPDGAVFKLDSGAVGEGLFAAFSGQKGMVRFNLGASFKFAPPSDDFAAFDDGITPVSADDHQEDDEPPSVDEISKRCAHGCPWMGWRHVKAALGVLEATGRITPKEADRAYDDACWQGHNFRRADRNKKIGVWLQALKDAEKDQEAARQREAVAKANPPQRPRIVKKCPHDKQAYRCQECGGAGICAHNKRRDQCKDCGPGPSKCPHDKQAYHCQACGGAGICAHNRRRDMCKDCGEGRSKCPHGKQAYYCQACGGAGICAHNRRRDQCKDCGTGRSKCPHGKQAYYCQECGGAGICAHNRKRDQCKDCGEGRSKKHKGVKQNVGQNET